MRRSRLVLLALFAALVLAFVAPWYLGGRGGAVPAGGGPETLAGAPAQSFELERLGGGRVDLERYRGKVVVANLWATWCGPCRNETPALERLAKKDRARGLVVLGVNQGESASTVASFAREMHLDYPLLLDVDQRYGRAYAAIGLPTTIVIGRDGKIVRGTSGEMTYAQMEAAVEPSLAAR